MPARQTHTHDPSAIIAQCIEEETKIQIMNIQQFTSFNASTLTSIVSISTEASQQLK